MRPRTRTMFKSVEPEPRNVMLCVQMYERLHKKIGIYQKKIQIGLHALQCECSHSLSSSLEVFNVLFLFFFAAVVFKL